MARLPPEVLVFVHIPKCAGSSFRQQLRRWYGEDALLIDSVDAAGLAEAVRERGGMPRAIGGHLVHGVHRHLDCTPRYVSLVRDPADRLASLYRHARARSDHPFHERAHALAFPAFYEFTQTDPRARRQTVGIQCFFLAQARSFAEAAPVAAAYAALEPVERYSDFLARCAALAGRPPDGLPPRNVGAEDVRLDEAKAALADRIRAENPEDVALYRYVQSLGARR